MLLRYKDKLVWRSEGGNTKVPSDLLCNIASGVDGIFVLEFGVVAVVIGANLLNCVANAGYHTWVTSMHGPKLLLVHRLDLVRGLIKCRDRWR